MPPHRPRPDFARVEAILRASRETYATSQELMRENRALQAKVLESRSMLGETLAGTYARPDGRDDVVADALD